MTEHIRINPTAPRVAYVADGVQSAFTFPFAIFKPEDLEAWLDDTIVSTGFSVSGAGVSTGGTAIFAVPPANGTRVTLRRRMEIARTSDFQADGVIRAKTINDELDQQIAAIQQIADDVGRCVARSVTSTSLADLTLPEPAPGKALGWNADGTALVNDPADFAATAATVTAQAAQASSSAATAQAAETQASAASAAALAAQNAAALSADAAAERAAAADVARIEWKGAWSAVTAYAAHDAVSHGGASWICIQAHTNQTPADNAWWDPLAAKGIDGTGFGDLIAANNLSDLADIAAARTNLGLAIGTDVQAHDADMDWLAANITAAGKALLDDTDAAAQRVTLGAAAASHAHTASDLGSGSASSTTYLRGDQTWATVPAGALEFVSSVTASGASAVDFTSLTSGYDYLIQSENFSLSGEDGLILRFGTGAGPTYQTTGYVFTGIKTYGSVVDDWSSSASASYSAGISVQYPYNDNSTGSRLSVKVADPAANQFHPVEYSSGGIRNFNGVYYLTFGIGCRSTAEAITGLRLMGKGGSTITGTFLLFRIKRSA